MKRLLGVFFTVALGAAALAAWGGAASGRSPEAAAPASPAAAEQKRKRLPPLPRQVKQRKRWLIGVKCDTPPFGYIDIRGKNAGFDVEIAQWFARYAFGNKNRVTYVCAPTAAREPLLTTGRVDMVISTFTYTADRDTRIDFSRAYFRASGRLLVPNNSSIQRLNDIRGKRIATTDGSIYQRWINRCFSGTEVVTTTGVTESLLRLQQGRADAVMWDDGALAPVAASDRNTKLTNDVFLEGPYGIGFRQGDTAMKRWVDSRLAVMKQKDLFMTLLRNNFAGRFVTAFSRNILRPKNNIRYLPPGPSLETICP
jgi:polar amino acid transport system substrate-binding protein